MTYVVHLRGPSGTVEYRTTDVQEALRTVEYVAEAGGLGEIYYLDVFGRPQLLTFAR